ncbi:MAG: TadE/TadG family type IV pilus assembly protein [Bacillota bacterium]
MNIAGQRGAVTAEFALVSTVLLLMLLMCLELGLILDAQLVVTGAARDGARQASIDGGWSRAVEERVEDLLHLGGLEVPEYEIEVQPHRVAYGRPVSVRVEYPYRVRSPFLYPIIDAEIPLAAEVVTRSERLEDR